MIRIVLLGAGNVATHLFKAFRTSKRVDFVQWYNRNIVAIEPYKNEVLITQDLLDLKPADVYILAVSDDAISNISSKIHNLNGLLVHTSGSVSIHKLDKKHRRGVFYPLQSFTKNLPLDFNTVPICLEAIEKEDLKQLQLLAEALGSKHYKISTEQRQTLHLAAVYVNNFVNQLYRIAHEITESKQIDFNVLKPLILETANKIQHVSPYLAQTGPAKRNDKKTIKNHLKIIKNSDHKDVYELLTKLIQHTHLFTNAH